MTIIETKQFKKGTKEPLRINLNGTDIMRCKTCRNYRQNTDGSLHHGTCIKRQLTVHEDKLKCQHYE